MASVRFLSLAASVIEQEEGEPAAKRWKKNSHVMWTKKDIDETNKSLKEKFLVEMPQDFFDFLVFCQEQNEASPLEALYDTLGLILVGPYDVVMGKFEADETSSEYFLHWRYYYDPPEFMTVIKGDDATGFHIGYFRDDPNSMPSFIGSNKAEEGCEITVLGENLFAAINSMISSVLKKTKDKRKQSGLKTLQTSLEAKAKELKYSMTPSSTVTKARNKKVVTKSFHKAGIVVPLDENEVGYRPLLVTDGELKRILTCIVTDKAEQQKEEASDQLQETITLIQFANDECDYGMGLELGIDLFCFGHEKFHDTILQLLPLAYQLLGRNEYARIIEAHIKNRKHEPVNDEEQARLSMTESAAKKCKMDEGLVDMDRAKENGKRMAKVHEEMATLPRCAKHGAILGFAARECFRQIRKHLGKRNPRWRKLYCLCGPARSIQVDTTAEPRSYFNGDGYLVTRHNFDPRDGGWWYFEFCHGRVEVHYDEYEDWDDTGNRCWHHMCDHSEGSPRSRELFRLPERYVTYKHCTRIFRSKPYPPL